LFFWIRVVDYKILFSDMDPNCEVITGPAIIVEIFCSFSKHFRTLFYLKVKI